MPGVVLAGEDYVRAGKIEGPADLSGALRMMWDDVGLFFALDVTDDVLSAPNGEESFWVNDLCQFAFDSLLNGPGARFDHQDISYFVEITAALLMAGRGRCGPSPSVTYAVHGACAHFHRSLEDRCAKMAGATGVVARTKRRQPPHNPGFCLCRDSRDFGPARAKPDGVMGTSGYLSRAIRDTGRGRQGS